jgi:quercetin dioxygenase-like cupin family protein
LLDALSERRIDPAADRGVQLRSPRVHARSERGEDRLTALPKSRTRHRTRVRGTGALREILPYYRWGVAAGLLGAFVVAVFFLAIDLAAGRPLATPNALGSALFLGIPFDLTQPLRAIVILGYTAVHGALFAGVALAVSALVLGARQHPPSTPTLALLLTGSFFAALTVLFSCFSLISTSLAIGLHTPLVLGANLLASISMALLLATVFQTRWHAESQLAPRAGRGSARDRRRSHTGAQGMHERDERSNRLDPEWFHLFSLAQYTAALRAEREFAASGRSGLVLIKTEQLRVVLEVAAEGSKFAEHTVLGSALVVVLEGALEVVCGDERRLARAGEMVVIPHDRPRSMSAAGDVAFLWLLALEPPDPDSDARSFAPFGPPQAFGPRGS